MTTESILDTLVSDQELAELTALSARHVRRFAESGKLVRVQRGRYRLGDALPVLFEELTTGGEKSELQKQRTRLVKSQADRAELEYAEAKKLVAPISEFLAVQSAAYAMIRANMRNIPGRAVLRLIGMTNETEFKRILREEINAALVTASQTEITPEDLETSE